MAKGKIDWATGKPEIICRWHGLVAKPIKNPAISLSSRTAGTAQSPGKGPASPKPSGSPGLARTRGSNDLEKVTLYQCFVPQAGWLSLQARRTAKLEAFRTFRGLTGTRGRDDLEKVTLYQCFVPGAAGPAYAKEDRKPQIFRLAATYAIQTRHSEAEKKSLFINVFLRPGQAGKWWTFNPLRRAVKMTVSSDSTFPT